MGFHRIELGFTGFYWVSPVFSSVLMGFIGFYVDLLGFAKF